MEIINRIDAWSAKMDALRQKISKMEHRQLMTDGQEINPEIESLKNEMRKILEDINADRT